MLTYVINTSQNKTFDSEKLFNIVGYNKICWLNSTIEDIEKCAIHIYEKQNVLGADDFRVAVIVDLYDFDRIRTPYGKQGYGVEDGVELSLYFPYIEAYLGDHLFDYLIKKELFMKESEIYYVQNGKNERYDVIKNADAQMRKILSGEQSTQVVFDENNLENNTYSTFNLYCTETMSLQFKLSDYPYCAETATTMQEFLNAFRMRMSEYSKVRKHNYITPYGGSSTKVAFDVLSLSLYLIRLYEREESLDTEGEMEIERLDTNALKDSLITSWNKVNAARVVATENNSMYYSLHSFTTQLEDKKEQEEKPYEERLKHRYDLIKTKERFGSKNINERYETISKLATNSQESMSLEDRHKFDEIMSNYLAKRDSTRESEVEKDFKSNLASIVVKKPDEQENKNNKEGAKKVNSIFTSQCPTRTEYEHLIDLRHKDISKRFEKALAAEYIQCDYKAEKEEADIVYERYLREKKSLNGSLLGDAVFLILTLLVVLLPYGLMQIGVKNMFKITNLILQINAIVIFGGLFILAFLFRTLPILKRVNKAKREIYHLFVRCLAKKQEAFYLLEKRYKEDLVYIEEDRYEIRQITHLFEENMNKDKHVRKHRELLENLENCLSSILNNLGVQPVPDPEENVSDDFNLLEPFNSPKNKVYKVFSIEAIEGMFAKKGE